MQKTAGAGLHEKCMDMTKAAATTFPPAAIRTAKPLQADKVVTAAKPYLLMLPALLFLVAFTYYPMGQVLWDSFFFEEIGGDESTFVGLSNYSRLFNDGNFIQALGNNVIYAFGTVVPSMVFGLAFALLLTRSTRFNNFIRSLLFFPTLIPLIAAAALWIFIFLPEIGLIDYYLGKLGADPVNWLGDPDVALYALIILTVWKNAGYYMLFFLAGLQGISDDAIEAAVLEGATWWQRLRYVILPLLRPTTAFVFVIALIHVVTRVDHVILMTQGGPNGSTNMVLYYIYQNAHEYNDAAKATASTVVSIVILLAISVISIRTLERGVHYET